MQWIERWKPGVGDLKALLHEEILVDMVAETIDKI